MKAIAKKWSAKLGLYARIDMFVTDDSRNEIYVQEYTFNHLGGTKHCAAKTNDVTGCIDLCFLGNLWSENGGDPKMGGPKTARPSVFDAGYGSLSDAAQCSTRDRPLDFPRHLFPPHLMQLLTSHAYEIHDLTECYSCRVLRFLYCVDRHVAGTVLQEMHFFCSVSLLLVLVGEHAVAVVVLVLPRTWATWVRDACEGQYSVYVQVKIFIVVL